jgi:hypothetical protein
MRILFLSVSLFVGTHVAAQTNLPIPANIQRAYTGLTRDRSGKPGSHYWQNTADYSIRVQFNPLNRLLDGSVGIDYVNNSPDTLKKVVCKLYPNLYQIQAVRSIQIAPADLTSGVVIKSVRVDDAPLDSVYISIKGTNMVLRGHAIPPHGRVHYDIAYSYVLNKGSFVRTGQIDTGAFFIAYFFPRIAVYDDIDGWNEYPYTGQYEFYNDYGRFRAAIVVPGDYQVWGTGTLENPDEVYQPLFLERLDRAGRSDSVTDIVTERDIAAGCITHPGVVHTWKFYADSVTDLAIGISNHYVWKAASPVVDPATRRRTRVDAVFNPGHPEYAPIIDYAVKTVDIMSRVFPGVPYPYAHETVFDGPDEMEFPMMVDNMPFRKKTDALELTAHEIFHTLFPFYVGTNETKYSFMDEGWATLTEFWFPTLMDTAAIHYDFSDANNSAGSEQDVPIMTLTPQLMGAARFSDKDLKPALGYLYVKEMLGDRLFLKALQFYIINWKGKHPTPYDFFYCMNTGSGVNLDWFWKNWFFEKNVPDLAIGAVHHRSDRYTVVIENRGTGIVPIHLHVWYKGGRETTVIRDINCWKNGNKTVLLSFPAAQPVEKLVLGNEEDLDVDKSNNIKTIYEK